MFSIVQDQRGAAEQGASGWAYTVGIARRIWLNDEGSDLMIEPIETLHTLEDKIWIDMTAEGTDVIIIVPTVGMTSGFSMGDIVHFTFKGNVVHIFSKEDNKNLEFCYLLIRKSRSNGSKIQSSGFFTEKTIIVQNTINIETNAANRSAAKMCGK